MGKSQITGKELGPGLSQRKDGRFVRSFRENGKVQKVYGKTIKEVREKYKQALVKAQTEEELSSGNVTLDDYFKDWVNIREKYHNIRESSAYKYRLTNKAISKYLGKRKIKTITPRDIEKMQQQFLDAGLTPTTTNQYIGILSKMFDSAVRKRLIPFNPVNSVERVRPQQITDDPETWGENAWNKRRNSRPLTEEEAKQFCNIAGKYYYGPCIKFLFATGVRQGEMRALLWKDVDKDKQVIKIRKTLSIDGNGKVTINPPKTKSGIRDLPLTPEIEEILDEQEKISKDLFDSCSADDYIFRNLHNKPVPRTTLREWFWKISSEMPQPFDKISSHAARHTFATIKCQTVNILTLKDILGHAHSTDGDVTANVYIGRSAEAMRKAMEIPLLK